MSPQELNQWLQNNFDWQVMDSGEKAMGDLNSLKYL